MERVERRRIVAGLFASIDGVVDGPEKWGFSFLTPALSQRMAAGVAEADGVLLGPQTYALFEQIWSKQSDDVPLAKFLNRSPKYVMSRRPMTTSWGPATVLSSLDALEAIVRLPGKNIQIPGSPRLVGALLAAGMLDELNLVLCPCILGRGLRIHDAGGSPLELRLDDVERFENGVLAIRYSKRNR